MTVRVILQLEQSTTIHIATQKLYQANNEKELKEPVKTQTRQIFIIFNSDSNKNEYTVSLSHTTYLC